MRFLIVLAFFFVFTNAQFFNRRSIAMKKFVEVLEHFSHSFEKPGNGKVFFDSNFQFKTTEDGIKTTNQFLNFLSIVGPRRFFQYISSARFDNTDQLIAITNFKEVKWETILKPYAGVSGGYRFVSVKPKGDIRKFIDSFF